MKVKEARHKAGYSLKQLAEKVGFSISTLSAIENEKKIPKDTFKLKKLCSLLNITPEDLWRKSNSFDSLKGFILKESLSQIEGNQDYTQGYKEALKKVVQFLEKGDC